MIFLLLCFSAFYPLLAQELREQRAAGLCHHIVQGGSCPFAEKCRFNHDVAGYLASKGPDLPGACPFSASPMCPYGGAPSNDLLAFALPACMTPCIVAQTGRASLTVLKSTRMHAQVSNAATHPGTAQLSSSRCCKQQPQPWLLRRPAASAEAGDTAGASSAEGSPAAAAGSQPACAPASRGADAQEPAALRGSSLVVVENGTVTEDPAPGTGGLLFFFFLSNQLHNVSNQLHKLHRVHDASSKQS